MSQYKECLEGEFCVVLKVRSKNSAGKRADKKSIGVKMVLRLRRRLGRRRVDGREYETVVYGV